MDLTTLIKDAKKVASGKYMETVGKAKVLLGQERGRFGALEVTERLVTLEPHGEALVVGDLHGDLESLAAILAERRFVETLEDEADSVLVFLGDYGDRGSESAEVYWAVLQLKLRFPGQVVLLKGNHEASGDLLASPHDLPTQFHRRFGDAWEPVYWSTRSLWEHLYNAVYVPERYLLLHGGVSPQIQSLQDIAEARGGAVLEDLLWSDPDEAVEGTLPSPRGAGKLFGKTIVSKVLERVNAKILIRGHEPADDGYGINLDGKVLTLFSRRGAPYFNQYGAYLQVSLSEQFGDANQMIRYIHRF